MAAFDKEKKLKYEIDKINGWDILAQKEYAGRKGFETGTSIVIVSSRGVGNGTIASFARSV